MDRLPAGPADVSRHPGLIAELASRGWSQAELAGLAGGNILRVLREAAAAAAALSAREEPSAARIEKLDGAAAGRNSLRPGS